MKKRVRLYKAQEGMQVQDPQQLQQMLIAKVQSDRQQGVPVEETVYNIYNSFQNMFNDPSEVQEFVTSVYESIEAQEQQVDQQMQQQPENADVDDMQDQIAAQAEAEMQRAQMGAQVGNPSYFTGIDAYVPPNYVDMMSNPAFAFGGQKSQYVKQGLAIAKKQMGGQEDPATSGPDEIGQNERTQKLKSFVNSLKTESTMANLKKQLEQQYDQMMTYAQDGGAQDYTHYTHGDEDVFHDEMNYLVEAQYGGMTNRQQRQLQKSMSRIPFGAVPTTPVSSIDVRRSGMFGRPKEYTINFASPLQAIGAPGGAGAYGYGIEQSNARKTEGKKGTVTIPGGSTTTTPEDKPADKKEDTKATETEGGSGSGGSGGGSGTGGGNTGEDNTVVQTPKPATGSNYQYIPGRPFVYTKSADGNSWLYKKENDDNWSTVTNQDALATLNTGQSKSAQLVTLEGKAGYYYRRRNDGSYIKYKGNPSEHYEGKTPVKIDSKPVVIKPGDKTYDYLDKNSTWNVKPYIPKAKPKAKPEERTLEEKNLEALREVFPDGKRPEAIGVPAFMDYGLVPTSFAMTFPGVAQALLGSGEAAGLLGAGEAAAAEQGALSAGRQLLNPGQGMLNPGQGMLNPGQSLLNPGQGMLNPGQGLLNPPPGFQFRMPFEDGGNVMNPGMDVYGNLQRFVYGGGDDPSIPFINQADMNYTNSKDTSDAYFQDGGSNFRAANPTNEINPATGKKWTWEEWEAPGAPGARATEEEVNAEDIQGYTVGPFDKAINQVNPTYQSDASFQNLFPNYQVNPGTRQTQQGQQMPNGYPMNYPGMGMFSNGSMMPWYAGSWNKVTKGPYGADGQSFNMPGVPGGNISKIDVTKSGLMGRPKKYSITYNNPNQLAPRTNTPGTTTPAAKPADAKSTPTFSNTEGLNPFTRSKVALGEFTSNMQRNRGERKYGTPEEQAREFERANPMQKMATNPLNQMRVSPTNTGTFDRGFMRTNPLNRMKVNPTTRGGLRGAQYGGDMDMYATGGDPLHASVDQDERLEPLPVKTLGDLKPLGQQMMMDSRKNIADEANFAPEEYTVDYKVKNAFNVNFPQAISAANAGVNKLASFLGRRQEEDFRPLTHEELTGTMARRQEGTHDEYGNYIPDKQANLSNSLYSKYGGSTVGDELDMTDEEIEEFLANGGELEFI